MQVLKGYNISHRIDEIRTSDAWGGKYQRKTTG